MKRTIERRIAQLRDWREDVIVKQKQYEHGGGMWNYYEGQLHAWKLEISWLKTALDIDRLETT